MAQANVISTVADSILAKAAACGWNIGKLLNKGVDEKSILNLIVRENIVLPEEVFELYKWRNGTHLAEGDNMDIRHFFPGFVFMAFEYAFQTYISVKKDPRWNSSWFPVFANGGGDFYAIVCNPESNYFGSVVGFMLDEIEQPIEFESIYTMLKTIDDCFSEHLYYVSDKGFLEADDVAAALIAKKHNE